jgi:deoxyhypusine synthase
VTAPVTDGSLSACPPAEAVTWGKVDKEVYMKTTESMQADYSTVMPFLVKALLENRARHEADPKAQDGKGYLRPREGYRLYEKRYKLVNDLLTHVAENGDWLQDSLQYPVALKR